MKILLFLIEKKFINFIIIKENLLFFCFTLESYIGFPWFRILIVVNDCNGDAVYGW